jgi:hemerythrin-like domain-containing protein
MPVQIGAQTHAFSDPTGLLTDCHRRIETFIGTLERVAEVIEEPRSEEVVRALETALRYFREAAPKHTADEELSLFPRMRQIGEPEVQAAFARLTELEDEHRWAEPLHAALDRLGCGYISGKNLTREEVDEFRHSAALLASMYRRHISLEDAVIFPLAARILSDEQKSLIATEMAERREVRR